MAWNHNAGGSAVRRLKESASVSNKEHSREIRRLEEELARVKEAASRAEDESSKKKTKGADDSKELKAEIKVMKATAAGAHLCHQHHHSQPSLM